MLGGAGFPGSQEHPESVQDSNRESGRVSEKIRAAACSGRASPRRGESESSRAPRYRTRVKRVGVNSLGLIVCLHAPRPQNHIVIALSGKYGAVETRMHKFTPEFEPCVLRMFGHDGELNTCGQSVPKKFRDGLPANQNH